MGFQLRYIDILTNEIVYTSDYKGVTSSLEECGIQQTMEDKQAGFKKNSPKNYIANWESFRCADDSGKQESASEIWKINVIKICPWEPQASQFTESEERMRTMANESVRNRFRNFANRITEDLDNVYNACLTSENGAILFKERVLAFLRGIDWSWDKQSYGTYTPEIPEAAIATSGNVILTDDHRKIFLSIHQDEIEKVIKEIDTSQSVSSPAELLEEAALKLAEVDWVSLVSAVEL